MMEEMKMQQATPDNSKLAIVEIKHNYNTVRAYPVNRVAHLLAQLAGAKTLTPDTRRIAKQLGYRFEEMPQISIL
jgi:hypothetical protein|tara:strand:- start:14083 stop:14307 length:225 start_codon:yes stop_codon:yes gene_type:complete